MAYQSYFSNNTATPSKAQPNKGNASGGGYKSYFGTANPTYSDPEPAKKAAPAKPAPPPVSAKQGLLNKFVSVGHFLKEDVAKPLVHTGEKAFNTVAAGAAATTGAVQTIAAAPKDRARVASNASRATDKLLDKGVGNAGSFLTSKQASSTGGGKKGYVDNFVKPVVKGSSEVAPLVLPVGQAAKGASLVTKVARGAIDNAVVGAGSSAASQAVDGKVKLKDIGKSAAYGAVLGGGGNLLHAGVGKAGSKVAEANPLGKTADAKALIQKQKIQTLFDTVKQRDERMAPKVRDTKLPRPGDVVMPTEPKGTAAGAEAKPTRKSPNAVESAKVEKPVKVAALPNSKVEGAKTPFDTPEIVKKRAEQEKIPSTHLDTSPERQQYRQDVSDTIYEQGGHAEEGKAPKTIARDKQAHIVLGAPASGKTGIVDPLLKEHNARLIDSDESKQLLGDVNEAASLHHESTAIADEHLSRAIDKGENIVYPLVGRSTEKIKQLIDDLHGEGYDVHMKYNHLDPELAASRAVSRYHETGRFVDPHYVHNEVALKPKATYDILKSYEKVKSYKHYDNNVGRGEHAKLVEEGSNDRLRAGNDQSGRPLDQQHTADVQKAPGSTKPSASEPTRLTPVQTAHMAPIDGFTHSSHMAQDYADMLREQEKGAKGAKGGINVHFEDVGAAGKHSSRISEHSQYYRDFYAENKKAPTRADYLEQAHRELESGHAAYGASDSYKALLERESKPVPRVQVESSVKPAEQGIPKVAKRIADSLKQKYDGIAGYDKITIKDQAEKAAKVMTDREHLDKIISGEKPLPDGLRATALVAAIRHDPVLGKDPALLLKIADSPLAIEASHAAQELRLAKENASADPIDAIRSVKADRVAAAERRAGMSVAKAEVADRIAAAKAMPKITKETWSSFVESIKC